MAIKKESITLSTGDVITLHEKTIVSDLKLQSKDKIEMWDLFEVCMDEESLKTLKSLKSNREDSRLITKTLMELNYPEKTEKSEEVSKKEETSTTGSPENTDGAQE